MRKTLTDAMLERYRPRSDRDEIFDKGMKGFGVRVTKNGSHFFLVSRFNGKKLRLDLGEFRHKKAPGGDPRYVTLAEARKKATEARVAIEQDKDPRAESRARAQAQPDTFASAAEDYIARVVRTHRKAKDTEALIRQKLIERWGEKPLVSISKRDVIDMVEDVAKPGPDGKGGPGAARLALTYAKAMLNWCIARDMIEHSPADRVSATALIGEKKHRQRVLSDEELRAFWRACDKVGYPHGRLYQLLLLTGTRLREGAGAQWGEFDIPNRRWIVPPERFKSDSNHLVPLADQAIDLLAELPRYEKGPHAFTTTLGVKAVGNFSLAKRELDEAMKKEMGKVPPFVIHDLRRTCRTRLASLKVPDTIAEQVIGHGKHGLQRVYDQHSYEDEMRDALQRWANKVRDIVEPPPANVTKMPRLRTA